MKKKSKKAAIEFANWILNKNDPGFCITSTIKRKEKDKSLVDGRKEVNRWGYTRLGYGKTYTTKQLFKMFKNESDNKG